jgi:hypothetical protein
MQTHRVRAHCLLSVVAVMAGAYAQSQEVGTITLIKDTPVRIIRGFSVYQGAEGMRLRQGDVLETGPEATSQVQMEFTSGAITELGPASHAYLFRVSGSAAEIILLTGWLKGETTSGNSSYVTSLATAATKGGNVLVRAGDTVANIFIERGAATVNSPGSAPISSSVERIFFTHQAGKPMAAAERPSAEFVGLMPVSFRDALPSRLPRFANAKPPTPKPEHDVTYEEIADLLRLPPGLRKGFVERFSPRLEDRSFRQAIENHLAALPEWRSVLYPDDRAPGSNR